MLVKNKNEWCWVIDGYVGYPKKSIEDCINDFAKRVIEEIIYGDLDDEIEEWQEDYLLSVKQEHIDELQAELTDVFRKWEKRHGYNNTSFVVCETIKPFENKEIKA